MVTLDELKMVARDKVLPCVIKEFGTFDVNNQHVPNKVRNIVGYIGMCLGYDREDVNYVRTDDGVKMWYVCGDHDKTIAYHPKIGFKVGTVDELILEANSGKNIHRCDECGLPAQRNMRYCDACVDNMVCCDRCGDAYLERDLNPSLLCASCVEEDELEDEIEESETTTNEGNE